MNQQRDSALWPFLVILVCLLLLSLTASRSWQEVGRRESISELYQRIGDAPPPQAAYPIADQAELTEAVPSAIVQPQLQPELARVAPAAAPPQPTVAGIAPVLIVPELARRPTPLDRPDERPAMNLAPAESPPTTDLPASPPAVGIRPWQAPLATTPPTLWAEPTELLVQIERLTWRHQSGEWALRAGDLLRELLRTAGPHDPRAVELLARLRKLTAEPAPLVPAEVDGAVAVELRLAQHALRRRLDVWERLPAMAQSDSTTVRSGAVDSQALADCLRQLSVQMASGGPAAAQWQEYLMVEALAELAEQPNAADPRQRACAQKLLARLANPRLDGDQRKFVLQGPLAELPAALAPWTAESLDVGQLLADLERFEQTNLPSDAMRLARHWRLLSWSTEPPSQEAGVWLAEHYRNANLRVAVSSELLNRMVPPAAPRSVPVHDTILGLPTRGTSTASTQLAVRLVPDRHSIRLLLEARGDLESRTRTTSGPVVLHSRSHSSFTATKPLEFTTDGWRLSPTEVQANNRSRLAGVTSEFDSIPLLGALVESFARSQHEQSQPAASREVDGKLRSRVGRQIDEEATAGLQRFQDQFAQRVMLPLDQLGLAPECVELQTTDQRLAMRFRLAGEHQLAGHAPRPRAPSDSLLSLQVHQSLLNNVCEQLGLNGQSFQLPELRDHLARRLNIEPDRLGEIQHDDVRITFAAQDAVRIRCEDGRIELALAVAALEKAPRAWRNFVVRVRYRADYNLARGEMVRDGVVLLQGEYLSLKEQLPLRGIFTKLFPPERRIYLLPEQVAEHPAMAGLEITQLEIRDGWIGLALGPQRHDRLPRVAQRLDP